MSSEDGSPFKTGLASEVWDTKALLKWTNEVRTCLGTGSSLSDEQVEVVSTLLKRLLDDEKRGNTPSLVFIAKTRFDLLVREILSFGTSHRDQRASLQAMEMQCFAVQRIWRKHFKLSSFVAMIEEERQRRMEEFSLEGVEQDKDGKWIVEDPKPPCFSEKEGSHGFEPGQWWLNIACCYRDGMVGHMADDMTKSPYGVTAIPLLAGEEIESSVPNCFTYRRTGPIQDMYLSIMRELGQRNVRILRGHKLNSPYAPKGGIRYDGLYTPMEYSHKLNTVTNMYEVKLLFKRNWGTPAVETLLNVPTPSQLDEWKIYLVTAANEREINRSPNRLRLTPQGKETRTSALLASPEFLEALKTDSPSSSLKAPESSTPTQSPRKKHDAFVMSGALNDMLDQTETGDASSSRSTSTRADSPVFRGRTRTRIPRNRGSEESGRTSDLVDMLNQGPDDASSSSNRNTPALRTPSKSPAGRKKMIPQGNEERGGFMRSSDFMDMLNEDPPGGSSNSSLEAAPAPRTPSKSPAKKTKMIPQGNEERSSLLRSPDFMDMLNEGPPDEPSSQPTKTSPASAKKILPSIKAAPSVKGKSKVRDSGIGGVNDDEVFDNKKFEEPVIVRKRAKVKDPYDIDDMIESIERAENAKHEEGEDEEEEEGVVRMRGGKL